MVSSRNLIHLKRGDQNSMRAEVFASQCNLSLEYGGDPSSNLGRGISKKIFELGEPDSNPRVFMSADKYFVQRMGARVRQGY